MYILDAGDWHDSCHEYSRGLRRQRFPLLSTTLGLLNKYGTVNMRLAVILGALLCAQTCIADSIEQAERQSKNTSESEQTEILFKLQVDRELQEKLGDWEVREVYVGQEDDVQNEMMDSNAAIRLSKELWSATTVQGSTENEIFVAVTITAANVDSDTRVVIEGHHRYATSEDGCSDSFAFGWRSFWGKVLKFVSMASKCKSGEATTARLCNNTNRGYQTPSGTPNKARNDKIQKGMKGIGISLPSCKDNGCENEGGACQVDAVKYEEVEGSDQSSQNSDCGGTKEWKVSPVCLCDAD